MTEPYPAHITASAGIPIAWGPAVAGLALTLGTLALLLFAPLSATVADAHTDLIQGSPGPAQQVGGTVDFVDLVFADEVSDVVITLEDPNGELLPGNTVVSDGQIIRYEMPAIDVVGRYILRFSMISADGDFTESGYFFVYEPDSIEPYRLGEVDVPNSNATIIAVISSIVFGICVIGLVMIFLAKLERDRAKASASGT